MSVDEALANIQSAVFPLATETLPLSQAIGRIAHQDVRARLFNPAFDVSAMDGYAVRAADIVPDRPCKLIGTSQAGSGFEGTLAKDQCVRIFTGAPLPEGADAVIMQEDAKANGDTVSFQHTIDSGRHVRIRGEDFSQGDLLIEAGQILTPARLALAAAGNVAQLDVATLPRIAILATGDELVFPGQPVGPDQIVASNSVGLSALFGRQARQIDNFGIVPDNLGSLRSAISNALADKPDVLVTTGGASVGEHDFVQSALNQCGVEIHFWKIAMRPGKPLMFGRHGKTLVFGLPGNPVSALVTARIFILPALWALARARPVPSMAFPLAKSLGSNGPRRHYLRGRFVNTYGKATMVSPIAQTDSGHLSSLASADVLIEQKEHCPGKSEGDLVCVHIL